MDTSWSGLSWSVLVWSGLVSQGSELLAEHQVQEEDVQQLLLGGDVTKVGTTTTAGLLWSPTEAESSGPPV